MAIILTAGILIAAVEFSIYTVNSLRQARNIDRSLIAYYAAESGAESALHQLRKRPIATDAAGNVILNPSEGTVSAGSDGDATWNLQAPQFSGTSDVMRTMRLAKNQSLAIPLYGHDGVTPLDIHSMKVIWESESNCDGGSGPAWVQSKVATWGSDGTLTTEGTILQWGDPSDNIHNIKQYVKTPSGPQKQVIFNDVSSSEIFPAASQEQPLVVQVTSLYCDLFGVNISFYSQADAVADSHIPMSNMYTIAPQGDYQGVRQQLHLTLPSQIGTGLSSLFDYVLFSENTVEKN